MNSMSYDMFDVFIEALRIEKWILKEVVRNDSVLRVSITRTPELDEDIIGNVTVTLVNMGENVAITVRTGAKTIARETISMKAGGVTNFDDWWKGYSSALNNCIHNELGVGKVNGFVSLPNELIVKIMLHVGWRDIVAASMSCQRLNYLSKAPELWKRYSNDNKKIASSADIRTKLTWPQINALD